MDIESANKSANLVCKLIDSIAPIKEQQKIQKQAIVNYLLRTNKTELRAKGKIFKLTQSPLALNYKNIKVFYEDYLETHDGEFDMDEYLLFVKKARKTIDVDAKPTLKIINEQKS
jgi:hypothetical protein